MHSIVAFFRNILTERDNQTLCVYRVIAFIAAGEMVWKFWFVEHVTFSDFSEGITGIGVAIAAKNWSEKQ